MSVQRARRGLEDEARALYLSSHYRSPRELERAADAIRAGEPPEIDEAFVVRRVAEARARGLQTLCQPVPWTRDLLWLAVVALTLVVVAIAGLAFLAQ